MPKYSVKMLSGETYDVDAKNGDDAKKQAYDLAIKAHPNLAAKEDAQAPERRVAQVIHPES